MELILMLQDQVIDMHQGPITSHEKRQKGMCCNEVDMETFGEVCLKSITFPSNSDDANLEAFIQVTH